MALKQSEVWAEAWSQALTRSEDQVKQELEELIRDHRLPSLLAWINGNRESYIAANTSRSNAAHHGVLAHTSGSIDALQTLLSQLKQMTLPKAQRKQSTE